MRLLLVGRAAEVGYGFFMLGQGGGEMMAAGTIGPRHEIKISRHWQGVGRLQRLGAGIGDRARRQTGMGVGVIGVRAGQVGFVNDSVIAVVQSPRKRWWGRIARAYSGADGC